MLDQRGQLLRAALGFAGLPRLRYDRALSALRAWLDSWPGIGHVAVGMHRQGFDLQLTQYDERGWRATFYTSGMEHSPTSATGTGWEPTPWHGTQRAALGGARPRKAHSSGLLDSRQPSQPRCAYATYRACRHSRTRHHCAGHCGGAAGEPDVPHRCADARALIRTP